MSDDHIKAELTWDFTPINNKAVKFARLIALDEVDEYTVMVRPYEHTIESYTRACQPMPATWFITYGPAFHLTVS